MSQIPSSIGRYDVMSPIGQGGMGSLFLAWDPKLERKIAIKLLRDDDESLRERFAREARAAARLRHPNIVTIFDVGEHEGQPFIAMEYIQGHTLAEMIHRKTAMPMVQKVELMEALCDGLGFAHKAGIVHRDVKPANLMVDSEGALKILDFGIARATESAGMTQAGMLIGTLNYMSPEQVNGATVDARSDIFAVGAVCYELLAYKQAFPGGLLAGILNKILTAQYEPLETVAPGVDPELAGIVARALQRDPAARYQDLQSMRKELMFLRMRLETQPGVASPDSISDAPTMVVPTPVPVRRTSDREDLLRRRTAQIERHLADAEQKLGAHDFEGAIAACEHALVMDADHDRATALLDRARAGLEEAARKKEEAQRRADAVRDLVTRAQAALDAEAFVEAIALADEALAADSAAPGAQALKTRAAEGQRRADAKRAEAERLARLAREAADHVQAASELLARHELPQALARVDAALAIDPQLAAARQLRGQIDLAIREDADRRRAEEAARRAEEAAARHREKASAAALKQARKAKSAEAAVAVLREALRADPNHAELQLLLTEKESEHARYVAAQQEKQRAQEAAEAERRRQAAELAQRHREQAEQAEKQRAAAAQAERERQAAVAAEKQRQAAAAAEKQRAAAAQAERERQAAATAEKERQAAAAAEKERQVAAAAEERRRAAQPTGGPNDQTIVLRPGMVPPAPPARKVPPAAAVVETPSVATAAAARPRPPVAPPAPATSAAAPSNQRMILIAAGAAVVVLATIGYFAFGRSDAPPVATDQNATAQAPAAAPSTVPPSVPVQAPSQPARPAATQPPPSESTPPADAEAASDAKALEEAQRTARQQLQGGDRRAALATAEAGLRLRATDRGLLAFVRQLQFDARGAAVSARGLADAVGPFATTSPAFRAAETAFLDAERYAADRRLADAVRAFWQAEESFGRAAQDGKAAREAADKEAEAKSAEKEAAAKAAPPPPPVAPARPDPAPAVNPDETAIRALMQRYTDAYTRSDANAVAAVTTLQANALRKAFDQLSSQRMQLSNLRITIDSATRARVAASLVHEMQPRAGAQNTVSSTATFLLEKRNGTWIIASRSLQ